MKKQKPVCGEEPPPGGQYISGFNSRQVEPEMIRLGISALYDITEIR